MRASEYRTVAQPPSDRPDRRRGNRATRAERVTDNVCRHRRSASRASRIAAASTRTPVAATRVRARRSSSTCGRVADSTSMPRKYSCNDLPARAAALRAHRAPRRNVTNCDHHTHAVILAALSALYSYGRGWDGARCAATWPAFLIRAPSSSSSRDQARAPDLVAFACRQRVNDAGRLRRSIAAYTAGFEFGRSMTSSAVTTGVDQRSDDLGRSAVASKRTTHLTPSAGMPAKMRAVLRDSTAAICEPVEGPHQRHRIPFPVGSEIVK